MTTTLGRLLGTLGRCYGKPPEPVTRDPFQMILWEQVGYLVTDAQRKVAFDALRTEAGLSADAIAAASDGTLHRIARLGGHMAADSRGNRLRQSAELVLRRWNGDLGAALRLPVPQARKALAEFSGIGEPGADKILVFAGKARLLPLDSNGLRVLGRVGLIVEHKDYRKTYRGAQQVLARHFRRVTMRSLRRTSCCASTGRCSARPTHRRATPVRYALRASMPRSRPCEPLDIHSSPRPS